MRVWFKDSYSGVDKIVDHRDYIQLFKGEASIDCIDKENVLGIETTMAERSSEGSKYNNHDDA
jgi:hypothetical protein